MSELYINVARRSHWPDWRDLRLAHYDQGESPVSGSGSQAKAVDVPPQRVTVWPDQIFEYGARAFDGLTRSILERPFRGVRLLKGAQLPVST